MWGRRCSAARAAPRYPRPPTQTAGPASSEGRPRLPRPTAPPPTALSSSPVSPDPHTHEHAAALATPNHWQPGVYGSDSGDSDADLRELAEAEGDEDEEPGWAGGRGLSDAPVEWRLVALPDGRELELPLGPDGRPLQSRGSALHFGGACKPCVFFHTKGCNNGPSCPFCHENHPKKKRFRKLTVEKMERLRLRLLQKPNCEWAQKVLARQEALLRRSNHPAPSQAPPAPPKEPPAPFYPSSQQPQHKPRFNPVHAAGRGVAHLLEMVTGVTGFGGRPAGPPSNAAAHTQSAPVAASRRSAGPGGVQFGGVGGPAGGHTHYPQHPQPYGGPWPQQVPPHAGYHPGAAQHTPGPLDIAPPPPAVHSQGPDGWPAGRSGGGLG